MKRILLILVTIFWITSVTRAQTPAPITGASAVCLGSGTALSDATPGGIWSSSSTAVAYVNPATGFISGISAGVVNVTYTVGTHSVTKIFSVWSLPVITPDTIKACVGSTYYLTPNPSGGGWTTSTPTVATVNYAGAVLATGTGTATLTYTSSAGCISSATITVNPIPLPITGTSYCYTGTSTTLTDVSFGGTWSTSDASLATVDASGVVTGVTSGLVLISYQIPSSGCAATYRVDVNPLPGTTNLYAWYPFCGDTTDHSGNGRDLFTFYTGAPVGARPTLAVDRFGNANNAYFFAGGNGIMQFSTYFTDPGLPPDFTLSCWVNLNSVAQSSIILYNGNPNTDGFGFVINDGLTGFPGVAGYQASVLFGGVGQFSTTDLTPLGIGGWHNLVLVKNGGSYHFYVDDGPALFFIASYNIPSIGSVFALGGNASIAAPGNALGSMGFTGDIDDVAYITRQLSLVERSSIFNFNPDAKHFTFGTHDTTICSDNMKLAPNPQTIGGQYTWTTFVTGTGYVVTDTADTSIVVYPFPGIIGNSYALTVSKPYGCSAADTIEVYKSPINVNLGPASRNFCKGDTITLSSHNPGSTFTWSTGDTSHSIQVTTTGTYYVTVDSIIHLGSGDSAVCVGRDTVYLHASTVPIITMPTSVINCAGNPAQIYTYSGSGYTYIWSNGYFGDSTFLAGSGSYYLQVTDSGCVRSDTGHAVIINEAVTLLNHDTAVCYTDKVQAIATNNPAVTYQWTPTAGISVSNLPAATIIPDTSAEYYVTVSFPGCPNIVDSFHIDVQPIPTVSIGGSKDLCQGDTLHITAVTGPSWYSHFVSIWNPPTSNLDTIDGSTVVYTANTIHDSEILIVKVYPPVYLTNPGDSFCYAMDSAAIYVHPRFNDTMSSIYSVCPGDSLQLNPNLDSLSNALGVIVTSSKWTPGVYLNDSFSSNPWIHPITSVGYRLIAYSQFGCPDTVFTKIQVNPAAILNIDNGDSVVLSLGQFYHIQPQTNCETFLWYPPLGMDNIHSSDPTITPPTSTTYSVVATTPDGCVVYDSFRVHVDLGMVVAIPNAFTPEGPVNTVFKIINQGAVGINYFRIFDRWGNKVFETTNINSGWDGMYNGKPQPYGVYVYDLEAITSSGIVIRREGNLTLIR